MGRFIAAGVVCSLTGCILAGVVAVTQATAQTYPTEFDVRDTAVYMYGEINTPTLGQFRDVIAANPQIATLVLCEVPGSTDDATMIPLSYLVRQTGLNTHLTAQSLVASGGTDLFLAGVRRTIESGAEIGVHSWSDGTNDAADFPRSAVEHKMNADYIRDMLGDDAFYWFTIYAAPAAEMHWMTDDEIAQYGLATGPVTDRFACPD